MNDSVPSRTQKTREYMAQCDVVLFLSRASQFWSAPLRIEPPARPRWVSCST